MFRKKLKSIAILGVILLFAGSYSPAVEISGFTDISCRGAEGENTEFSMGAFEIDFISKINNRINFEGAIVVEGEEIGLGQTLIDGELVKNRLGIQVGLLDIPFGIDYRFFATPDRVLISAPLTTDIIIDGGWSDTGLNLYGQFSKLNYNLYLVNGMGENSGDPVNQSGDNNNSKTLGTRVGFEFVKNIEIGASFARGSYLNTNNEEMLTRQGVDINASAGIFDFKGEYIGSKKDVPGSAEIEQLGYYLQATGNITDKLYSSIRWGYWEQEKNNLNSLTAGAGYRLNENFSLKTEYQINKEEKEIENNTLAVQAVIGF